ncbi:MAG TPA: TolC family protein [Chitinophagales bacterium]|nr:TolC family protein [Chitinophagales bacterium]
MRPLIFLFVLTTIFGGTLQAQEDSSWTLERCVSYAIQNNIAVKEAAIAAKTANNQYLQSGYNLLPSVTGTSSYNVNFGNSLNPVTYSYTKGNSRSLQIGMQGDITLFNGLQQIFGIEKSRYDLLASKSDYENAKSNISLNVASGYLQIILDKEILQVAEKQKTLTNMQLNMVQRKVSVGALPESSLLEVQAQAAADDATIVNAKGSYELAVLALKQLLQLTDDQPFDVIVPQVNADNLESIAGLSPVSVYSTAVNTQPSIKSAEAQWKSAQMARKIAWGAITPTISGYFNLSSGYSSDYSVPSIVNGQLVYDYPGFNQQVHDLFRQVIGISLNVPIFGKLQRFTNIGNAGLQMQVKQLELENAKNKLRQDVEQAYENARIAAENYVANKKSYESAGKSYDAVEKRYEGGLATNFDLQQAKNQLAKAESNMIQAKYTYVFRMKILDYYQGKPLTLN